MQEHEDILPPVFIISPTGKSGTNFLARALCELGICEFPQKSVLRREDFLLFHSEHLAKYVQQCSSVWERWEHSAVTLKATRQELFRYLGEGILAFLGSPTDSSKRILVKTPHSRNLEKFATLFPSVKLLLLIRDGRDATESQVRAGYREDYKSAFENWAARAREIASFTRDKFASLENELWTLSRYEDLVKRPAAEFSRLAEFLGHSASLRFEKVERLPVMGSSYLAQSDDKEFVWKVANRPPNFNPIGRWSSWADTTKNLFKEVAGAELILLGYENSSDW